ncbi:DUF3618 domain-containing protein [Agilicoccus flavus]|uniref:DUF3618 domain-containing protein n=1 Tax=Agilicoccus flavus TaxID=2775968 RepID=UPI001CF70ED0|nr:DUF3618 domain-containing protein [Agilicoccus flavus]
MSAQDNRSLDQIEKDIERTRGRLASTIDELAYRVKPANLAKRQADSAKTSLFQATHATDGSLRYEIVGPVAAVVVGLVALAIYNRVKH